MHTKSDILASIGVIVSLIITKSGYRIADTITELVIAFLIARIGYWKFLKKHLMSSSIQSALIPTAPEGVIKSVEGVKGCHDIRTRGTEHSIYLGPAYPC